MRSAFAYLLLIAFLGVALPMSHASGRGRNKKLYAVPAPAKVTIDAKLDDWDLSGQILSYVVPETADMQSSRLAMMYDAEALYISGMVRDTSPMMNRHDPKVDPKRAWDADVCQIFFSLDPRLEYPVEGSSFAKDPLAPVGTMYIWYFTDRQEPCLAMYRGMKFDKPLRPELGEDGVIPADKFQGAYRQQDDGGGYIFEYRIPFATIGFKVDPKANDILAMVMCTFWSRPDGLKTAGGAAWAYDVMAGPGFPWQSTLCYGKLIFSPEGNLPKELVEEGLPPERPLPLKFSYPVPEDSEVTVQLFDQDNVVRRILVAQGERRAGKNTELWDGLDDQGAPLPPGEYRWAGVYHEPIKHKFLFSAHNSGQPPYPTDNNRGGWGGDHGIPTTAVAVPGGAVLAWSGCEYGWGLIRVTTEGKKLWGSKHSATYLATDGKRLFAAGDHGFHKHPGVAVMEAKDCRPINFGNKQPYLLPPEGGAKETNEVSGLAYHANKLYASFHDRNLIAVYDADQGELLETIEVPAPGAIAVGPDGTLNIVSGENVRRHQGDAVTKLDPQHLDQPSGLACAPDGTLYVTNQGERQDIAVFAADGTFQRRLGKAGGRPAVGTYEAEGMFRPKGLAVDEQGQLWVAENADSPKRFSVWNPADGKLAAEYFGSSSYFAWGWIDPAKPHEILAHNVLWDIDWQKNTVYPRTTIWRKTAPDMVEEASPSAYNGTLRIVTAKNGRQYAWGKGKMKATLFRRDGELFRPFFSAFHVSRGWSLWRGLGIPVLDDPEQTPDGAYCWQDANNDQRVQADEIHRFEGRHFRLSIQWLDEDLNVWCGQHVMRPTKVDDNGQPHYDPTALEATPVAGTPVARGYQWLDDEGSFYGLAHGQKPSLAKYDAKGQMQWGYPNLKKWHDSLNLPIVKAGRLWGMTGPLGIAGDFTGNMTYFGVCHVFHKDTGVYIAALNRDGRAGGGSGWDIGQPEGQTGQLVKLRPDPAGPERYFLIEGGQDSRVREVLGLDTVQPLAGGTYVHTEEAARTAKEALEAYNAKLAAAQKLTIARGRKALDLAQPVGKTLDADRGFQVRAAYDAENLYLKYSVSSKHELVNSITEPKLIFKGGNCLDIQLATDPEADPKRKKPAPGDLRLLVTRQGKKPLAVLYQTKVAGFQGEPFVFSSPTGQEAFDRVEVVSEQVELDYRPKKTKDGFTAIVTIPHALTGLAPQPTQRLLMDVGYLFGNKTGAAMSTRSYWRNNSFTANVINDIPHESRLEPGEWGEALVE